MWPRPTNDAYPTLYVDAWEGETRTAPNSSAFDFVPVLCVCVRENASFSLSLHSYTLLSSLSSHTHSSQKNYDVNGKRGRKRGRRRGHVVRCVYFHFPRKRADLTDPSPSALSLRGIYGNDRMYCTLCTSVGRWMYGTSLEPREKYTYV